MSAQITKFVYTQRESDDLSSFVNEYVEEAVIKVENEDDVGNLKELGIGQEGDGSCSIYLIELAACSIQPLRKSLDLTSTDATSPQVTVFEEDIANSISDFFGKALGIHQSVFEDHAARGPKFRFSEDFTFPKAPSSLRSEASFLLRYYELISFTGDPSTLSILSDEDEVSLICSSTGRQIQYHQWQGCRRKDGTLLIVPRKCSFWVRRGKERGYDGM